MAEEIICLGKKFNSEEERREYFRKELRKKLPGLKKIDGFPIGEDEDIIALSDPPYYTACPNPWLDDFISEWESDKRPNNAESENVGEPYAFDISEGKTNPLYAAHSYHTKVPHPAIMRYILHYTSPGDVILDGFAGTGMTGVAALLCDKPDPETKYKIESEWTAQFNSKPIWGLRKAIIGDLSPAASFIAYNYTTRTDLFEYRKVINKIIKSFETDYGWMYQTLHTNGQVGKINYTVWSEMIICPVCNHEFSFTEAFYNIEKKSVLESIHCSKCNSKVSKEDCEIAFESLLDKATNQLIRRPKRKIFLINYKYGKNNYNKIPDQRDLDTIKRILELKFPQNVPSFLIPDMQMMKVGRVKTTNITHIHHFFLERPIHSLAFFWNKAIRIEDQKVSKFLLFTIEQMIWSLSVLNRFRPTGYSQVNQYLSGVFYVASHISEINPLYLLEGKIDRLIKSFNRYKLEGNAVINYSGDCANLQLRNNSIDYVFTDPPFGENIYYSDLNILIESWHRVLTNPINEAIVDRTKQKTLLDYQYLMEQCFKKYFYVLKPGKWMTVEFSNTSAAVWNSIQNAIQKTGFVIANVTALDKVQGTFQAVNSPTAVKQDLVISAYKPLLKIQNNSANSDLNTIWEFISEHLNHLPIHLIKGNNTTMVIERSPKILYDRLVTFLITRGLSVSINAKEFQENLKQKYLERDGMYFNPDQVAEYDLKKAKAPNVIQVSWQIATEDEGIEWLRRELIARTLKYQDIQPKWMQAITAVRKGDILPELRDILQQNFIEESDGSWRVPDMTEAKDREIIRNKTLIREFNGYVELANNSKSKRMKEVRVEALRAGFKQCWDTKDFQTIVKISDKIPENLLLEDEQLLMYYDIAKDRV
jgi:DNA modification methylase